MNSSWKIFLPLIFALILNFDVGTAAPVGGYLSGYEEVEPKPTAVSWWSTLVMAYFTAKFIGGRFNARMSTGGGRVLENLPLAPNRSVCIVEMAGRVFLLGVGENITFLDEITDEETIQSLREKNRAANDIFSQDFGSVSELVQKIPPIFKKK